MFPRRRVACKMDNCKKQLLLKILVCSSPKNTNQKQIPLFSCAVYSLYLVSVTLSMDVNLTSIFFCGWLALVLFATVRLVFRAPGQRIENERRGDKLVWRTLRKTLKKGTSILQIFIYFCFGITKKEIAVNQKSIHSFNNKKKSLFHRKQTSIAKRNLEKRQN